MLLDWLSSETGLRVERLKYFGETASKRYFVYRIPKKNGGEREIAHPAKPLKSLQRWLNSRLIKGLDVHPSAVAYKKGASIRANAMRHASSRFSLKIDFEDFFSSFKWDGIEKFICESGLEKIVATPEDLEFLVSILTRNREITIGAPTSPYITNAMMYAFDARVATFCEKRNLVYTRYADDIWISSFEPYALNEVYEFLVSTIDDYSYANLRINKAKTSYLSRKRRRKITGLILTSDGKVSIGRARKREIKSLVFQFASGHLTDVEQVERLKGLIAFCYDADNVFFEALKHKYGSKVIRSLIG